MTELELALPGNRKGAAVKALSTHALKPYWLYLLECCDGSFYAGIALDVESRFVSHVLGRGAAYTRARPPVRVLAARQYSDKGQALSAEYALKQRSKPSKLTFFATSERAV